MGRTWPPNSTFEWMVGQNILPRPGKKPILRVEISEHEDPSEEVVEITYKERGRRTSIVKRNKSPAVAPDKKVRFSRDRKAVKSALKKASGSDTSDTLIDTSDESDIDTSDGDTSDIDTSEDEARLRSRKAKSTKNPASSCRKLSEPSSSASVDSLPHPTCKCNRCVKGRKMLKEVIRCKSFKDTAPSCSKFSEPASSAAADSLPHPTCKCTGCVQGRKILKAVIQFEAKTNAAEAAAIQTKGKRKQKGKKVTDTDGDTSDEDVSEGEKKAAAKGKGSKKGNQKAKNASKVNNKPAAKPNNAKPAVKTAVNKSLFQLPEVPDKMKPNLIGGDPVAKVLRVEHALEGPYDPRPNAFYDNQKGIARVYHGHIWGNDNGTLYGDYPQKAGKPHLPAGVPRSYGHDRYYSMPPWQMDQYGRHGVPEYVPPQGYSNTKPPARMQGFPPPNRPSGWEVQNSGPNNGAAGLSGSGPPGPVSDIGSNKGGQAWGDKWPQQNNGSGGGSKNANESWGLPPVVQGWDSKSNKSKIPDSIASPAAPANPSEAEKGWGNGWVGASGSNKGWGKEDNKSENPGSKNSPVAPVASADPPQVQQDWGNPSAPPVWSGSPVSNVSINGSNNGNFKSQFGFDSLGSPKAEASFQRSKPKITHQHVGLG